MDAIRGALAALVTGIAATLVVVALAILPFLTPAWVSLGQARAQADLWTGFTPQQLRTVTDRSLPTSCSGPPTSMSPSRVPRPHGGERAHMRDVRGVFIGFFAIAAAGAAVLVGSSWPPAARSPDSGSGSGSCGPGS